MGVVFHSIATPIYYMTTPTHWPHFDHPHNVVVLLEQAGWSEPP